MFAQEFFVSVDPLAGHPTLKASALQRTRYRELSPVGQCAELAFVDRLEQDHFEDGRWASPLTNTPRIEVLLAQLLRAQRARGGRGAGLGLQPVHDVGLQDPAALLPPGPGAAAGLGCAVRGAGRRDLRRSARPRLAARSARRPRRRRASICSARAARSSASTATATGAATLAGWACDPEWPGAAVTVAIYGGAPREQPGSDAAGRRLRRPRAGRRRWRARSAPPATARARPAARHGFSFALPAGQRRRRSSSTRWTPPPPTGRRAPPTLLRNGIVDSAGARRGRHAARGGHHRVDRGARRRGATRSRSALEPSRLFVNGRKLVDWWDGPGPTEGSIDLGGGRQVSRPLGSLRADAAPAGFRAPA